MQYDQVARLCGGPCDGMTVGCSAPPSINIPCKPEVTVGHIIPFGEAPNFHMHTYTRNFKYGERLWVYVYEVPTRW